MADKIMKLRCEQFLERLYSEKELHKTHRHKHVIFKLTFVTSLFAIGSLGIKNPTLLPLLYLVPFIALCHDLFIFAENYKVKRIGIFILWAREKSNLNNADKECISSLEVLWEEWVKNYREPWAYRSSLALTLIVSAGSAIILFADFHREFSMLELLVFVVWSILLIAGCATVFVRARALMRKVTKSYEEALAK